MRSDDLKQDERENREMLRMVGGDQMVFALLYSALQLFVLCIQCTAAG